jgi:hypothetical protein
MQWSFLDNSHDSAAKKRLLEIQRIHEPDEFKMKQETRHEEMQKRRRKILLDLAHEAMMNNEPKTMKDVVTIQ